MLGCTLWWISPFNISEALNGSVGTLRGVTASGTPVGILEGGISRGTTVGALMDGSRSSLTNGTLGGETISHCCDCWLGVFVGRIILFGSVSVVGCWHCQLVVSKISASFLKSLPCCVEFWYKWCCWHWISEHFHQFFCSQNNSIRRGKFWHESFRREKLGCVCNLLTMGAGHMTLVTAIMFHCWS